MATVETAMTDARVHRSMLKWQRRAEERHDRGPWMGVSLIAGNLRVSKADAKNVLYRLIVAGLVEQFQFSNGFAYRALDAVSAPVMERAV